MRMQERDEHRWSRLMTSAQAGNETDYRQLLNELADVTEAFLKSRFGSYHFIEDCVQEALIAIHQARHTYDPKRSFRPWFFAIVRNKAIDFLRQQQTREKTVDHFKREQEILGQSGGAGFEQVELSGSPLLDLLPDQHKQVLVLTKVIGFSIAETAEKLEISESAAKVRVHRAIRKLRKLLEKDEP